MNELMPFFASVGVVVTFFSITGLLSRLIAAKLVNRQHLREEHPTVEDHYYFDPSHPTDGLGRRRPNGKRIAIIGPFGLCRKMTVRSRTIPMAIALARQGYEVKVFIPNWDCPDHGHKDHLAGEGRYQIVYLRRHFFNRLRLLPPAFNPMTFLRLLYHVLKFRPHTVYSYKPIGYSGGLALILHLIQRVPQLRRWTTYEKVIVDTDDREGSGGWSEGSGISAASRFLRQQQERIVLRQADAVTAVSKELEQYVKEVRGTHDNTVAYVSNGLLKEKWPDVERPQLDDPDLQQQLEQLGWPDVKVILVYTRFAEFRAERLIETFAMVRKHVPNSVLLVVGTSFDDQGRHERLCIPTLADRYGIGRERVILAGWIPYRKLPGLWAIADVALYLMDNTTINRSKSAVKVLELMAAGRAIVADRVGEVAQVIRPGISGLLVTPGNVREFADAVVQVLQDEELQTRLGEGARKRACEAYDWSVLIRRAQHLIDTSGAGNTGPRAALRTIHGAH